MEEISLCYELDEMLLTRNMCRIPPSLSSLPSILPPHHIHMASHKGTGSIARPWVLHNQVAASRRELDEFHNKRAAW